MRNFTQQNLYEGHPTVISVCVNTHVDMLVMDETYWEKTIRCNFTKPSKSYNKMDCTWHHLSLYAESNYLKIINFQNEASKYPTHFVAKRISIHAPVKVHWCKVL